MRAQRTTLLNSDINVTPLVDVCLVLLIIFMVVLPAMVNDVQLPESAYGSELEKRIFPVTVKNDGTVYLDTLVVRRDEVPTALQRLHQSDAQRPIAVRADKRVQYGDVTFVLRAAREAGWTDVTLVAQAPSVTTPPAPAAAAKRP